MVFYRKPFTRWKKLFKNNMLEECQKKIESKLIFLNP